MASGWVDVGAAVSTPSSIDCPTRPCSVTDFLESKGLGSFAFKIVEATDAETLDDLKLLDSTLVGELVTTLDLKLVSAKKLRLAIAEIRGELVSSVEDSQLPVEAKTAEVGAATATSPKGTGSVAAAGFAPEPRAGNGEVQAVEPQECIAICIDRSGSMGCPFTEVTLNVVQKAIAERTRMEAVKAMFYAFRDRVDNVGSGTHQLGLIQFDSQVDRLLDITGRLDRFEAIVDDMEKRGQTAIYSSIIEAVGMLETHFSPDSKTDLRILVLTDGQNNFGHPPEDALEAVNRIGAVVDAIIVGDRPDSNLRRIVSATGGECYQISSLGEGFELLEAEGVVSLRARRGGADKPPFERRKPVDFGSISERPLTSGATVQRAPALAASFAKKSVVDIKSLDEKTVSLSSGKGGASIKRVLMELKQVASGASGIWMHSGEGVHIFPAPDSVDFWRVLIEGPSDSPFDAGVFALSVIIPSDYPFKPPRISFETPVYHCNVSDSGNICLDILMDGWNPSLSVPKSIEAVRIMLQNPDTNNALRQWIAELTLAHEKTQGADTRYYDKARECTRKDASMTVEEWKQK